MGELEGSNVSSLMPSPFSSQHNAYLRKYIATRVPSVTAGPAVMVALKKDRSVIPVRLTVTPLPQPGGACNFAGVLHPIKQTALTAEVWLTTSASILCASPGLQTITAFTSRDVSGGPLSTITSEVRCTHEMRL